MQRPFHANGAPHDHLNIQRALTIAFVGVIHLMAIYGLLAALVPAARLPVPNPFQIVPVSIAPSKPLAPPLPTHWVVPHTVSVDHPIFDVPTQRGNISTTLDIPHPTTTPGSAVIAGPIAIAATHTTPPYPASSLRLGEQGTVRLALAIASDGRVMTATVERSSGSAALDQAAADWVRAHWRYRPAVKDGAAIAATTEADVRFDIRNAR